MKTTAKFLNILPGTQVVDIQRLRYINDEPIQLVTTYIPYAIFPPIATVDLTNRSLYEFLEKEGGIILSRGRRYIEATLANETRGHAAGYRTRRTAAHARFDQLYRKRGGF